MGGKEVLSEKRQPEDELAEEKITDRRNSMCRGPDGGWV